MPPLEEGVVPEQEVVGRAWPSLRRLALGTALAVPLAWLCFSGIQKVSSNWHAALQLDLQPSCLKDEELFAGICYMKCSLLTGGHAPHRVANAACCKADNDFFCTLISNLQAISPGLAVGGGASIHNSPHALIGILIKAYAILSARPSLVAIHPTVSARLLAATALASSVSMGKAQSQAPQAMGTR